MYKNDKKIDELKSLLNILENLKPDSEHSLFTKELSKELGYAIPPIVAVLMQCKTLIENRFADVFSWFEVLDIKELREYYSNRDSEWGFFSSFQIDENYNTSPDLALRLYDDPLSYKKTANDHLIKNVRHLLPVFHREGEFIVINLKPESLGEILRLSMGFSATVVAPNLSTLITDLIGGLTQGVYSVNDYNHVVSPENWYLKQKVRDGILEVDEFGLIVYDDASDAYVNGDIEERRIFTTPLISHVTTAMLIFLIIAYLVFHFAGGESEVVDSFKGVAFYVFLVSQLGMIVIHQYNAQLLKSIYISSPVIVHRQQIEALKPKIRINMYSALILMFALCVSALAAVVVLVNDAWFQKIVVIALSIGVILINEKYALLEERIRNLPVESADLDAEFYALLECWWYRTLPNF